MPIEVNNQAPEPTPAAAVDTPPAAEPAPPADTNFDFLGAPDDDFIELPREETPASPPKGEEPTPPEPKAEEGAPGTPPKEGKEEPAAPQKQEAEPPKAEPPKQEPPAEPAPVSQSAPAEQKSLVEQVTEKRGEMIDALAQDRFVLSQEDAAALELDPAGYAPKLMARAFYESTVSTLQHIQNYVPQIVQNVMQAMKANDEAEAAFYGQFKALDKTKHAADVASFIQMFRQANPKISQEDLYSMAASAVMAKYGLQAQVAQAPANPQAPGVVPAASPQPQPKPQPYQPAPNAAPVRVTKEPLEQFELLGMPDMDEAS